MRRPPIPDICRSRRRTRSVTRNHQYDLAVFYDALTPGRLPAVSFVKAKAYQDGHAVPAYSNPLDEQVHLVHFIDANIRSPYWRDTAIILSYDDSDGWYDYDHPPIVKWLGDPGRRLL
jgi:phospholipase C